MLRVSIITPCFAGEHYIGRTLASVRAQTFREWEQVIIDDGSPIPLAGFLAPTLAAEPRLKLIRQPNGGPCKARNAGFAASSADSDYLLFLDGDDLLEPTMLEVLVTYLDDHPAVGLVFCERTYIDENDQVIEAYRHYPIVRYEVDGSRVRKLPPDEAETPFEAFLYQSIALPSFTLLRRTTYERAGGWDDTFLFYDDTDLWLRMALYGEAHFVSQPLVGRRLHDQSLSNARVAAQLAAGERQLLEKWLVGRSDSAEDQARFATARQNQQDVLLPYLWWIWGNGELRQGHIAGAAKCYVRSLRKRTRGILRKWQRHTVAAPGRWIPAANRVGPGV